MDVPDDLIPIPPVVRQRLAENLREAQLLRSLLKLSIKADQVRGYGQAEPTRHQRSDRQAVRA